VEVLDHEDQRSVARELDQERLDGAEHLAPAARRVERIDRPSAVLAAAKRKDLLEVRRRPFETCSHSAYALAHPADGSGLVVAVVDAEQAAERIRDREKGRGRAVRGAAPFDPPVRLGGHLLLKLAEQP
jgi:hypothetical protein